MLKRMIQSNDLPRFRMNGLQCSVSMKLRIYAVAVGSWMREQDDKMSDLMSNPYLNFSRVEAEGCMNS